VNPLILGPILEVGKTLLDRRLEMWVNRGIGVWGLAVTLFALLQYGTKLIGR
jgi:hypothetical protein